MTDRSGANRFRRLYGRGRSTDAPPATQAWFPVKDIRDGCLVRKDGAVLGGLSLSALNLDLKSARETRAIISAVYGILNGLDVPWQMLSHYRPLDLGQYLESLKDQTRHVSPRREHLLRRYYEWLGAQQDAGEAMERHYYLLLVRTGPDAVARHRETLPGLAQEWGRIRGMEAQVMDEDAWRALLFGFFHPTRIRVEAVPHEPLAMTVGPESAELLSLVRREDVVHESPAELVREVETASSR